MTEKTVTAHGLWERLDQAPMSRLQATAVLLTVLLSALDGYDVLSVTFAAPAITHAWGIGKAALGVVLSAGLAGMAIGSFILAPFADLIGRRRMVFVSLALMGFGSLLCATAGSLEQLAAWRVMTGLGIGTCVAVINPLAAEFSNERRRPFALAAMAMGYPIGGLLGGIVAAILLRSFGWPAIFVAGFFAAVILSVIVALLLPESLAFLAGRTGPAALDRLNRLLARCGHLPLEEMPVAETHRPKGYAGVFTATQRGITLRLAVANLLNAAVAYYILSWLPQMVGDAGYDPSTSSLVAATSNLAGVAGGLILGALAPRIGIARIASAVIVGMGLATMMFGWVPPTLWMLFAAAAICGFFLFASAAGMAALMAQSFTDRSRASGVGFVVGIGRISSAAAPLAAGWLFASGFGRAEVSAAFGLAAVIGGLVLTGVRLGQR